jgi:NADPH-dependent 2,4-dienoyl-CoA reductase/sulfur reductase-like enzyme
MSSWPRLGLSVWVGADPWTRAVPRSSTRIGPAGGVVSGTRVLVAGASIAGPALAHWLRRRGAEVTVVERAAKQTVRR